MGTFMLDQGLKWVSQTKNITINKCVYISSILCVAHRGIKYLYGVARC